MNPGALRTLLMDALKEHYRDRPAVLELVLNIISRFGRKPNTTKNDRKAVVNRVCTLMQDVPVLLRNQLLRMCVPCDKETLNEKPPAPKQEEEKAPVEPERPKKRLRRYYTDAGFVVCAPNCTKCPQVTPSVYAEVYDVLTKYIAAKRRMYRTRMARVINQPLNFINNTCVDCFVEAEFLRYLRIMEIASFAEKSSPRKLVELTSEHIIQNCVSYAEGYTNLKLVLWRMFIDRKLISAHSRKCYCLCLCIDRYLKWIALLTGVLKPRPAIVYYDYNAWKKTICQNCLRFIASNGNMDYAKITDIVCKNNLIFKY